MQPVQEADGRRTLFLHEYPFDSVLTEAPEVVKALKPPWRGHNDDAPMTGITYDSRCQWGCGAGLAANTIHVTLPVYAC